MKNTRLLKFRDSKLIESFLNEQKKDFGEFNNLGWNFQNIEKHLNRANNFSIGYLVNNNLCGILIGEKIINDKKFDLEIHLMFVQEEK